MIPVEKPGSPLEVLEHFGVKGMKWGVRNNRSGGTGRVSKKIGRAADTTLFVLNAGSSYTKNDISTKATEKLIKSLPSIKARHGEYGKLSNRMKHPFSKEAKAYRNDVKKSYLKHLETTANSMTNSQGTWRYTLKENGKPNTSQYFWDIHVESVKKVKHADSETAFKVQPIFDDEGWIIDIKFVDDDMTQTMDHGANFLIHMGIDI